MARAIEIVTARAPRYLARMTEALIPADYLRFLDEIKTQVRTARVRATLAANRELVGLYWWIGREIRSRRDNQGWGAKVVERLSRDLREEFPDIKGFSERNLKYMIALVETWPDAEFVQQPAAQMPWGHLMVILGCSADLAVRRFYAEWTLREGWNRPELQDQIRCKLHLRQGKAANNFAATLPAPMAVAAQQILKDPYVFDFLGLGKEAHERDIERGMVEQIRDTLVELGVGFAFVGRQVRLEVAGDEFFLDLLFYHLRLHCYVVVELKGGKFTPGDAGQLNFYLSAVDDLVRDKDRDGPTIGLLLCRGHNRMVAEYALRDVNKPIGVAGLDLTRVLPEALESSLPTVEELEAELSAHLVD